MSKKISQLSLATDVTAADLLQVVDIEDGAMAQSGTNKKVTANILAQDLGKLMSVTATGSTQSRKITDRFADVVSVEDFGGESSIDITAINSAVTYARLNNKIVRFNFDASVRIPTDAPTLQSAIDCIDAAPGVSITLNIEAGHVLTSGFRINNRDCSFIRITSSDAVVAVSPSMTLVGNTDLSPDVPRSALIGFLAVRSKMPTWDVLIDMSNRSCVTGYELDYGSEGVVLPNKGVINTAQDGSIGGVNCRVTTNSRLQAGESKWTGAKAGNVSVSHNSFANLQSADLSTSANEANLDVSRGSLVHALSVNVSNGAYAGVYVRRSFVCLDQANLTNCSLGVWAALGSFVGATNATFDGCTNDVTCTGSSYIALGRSTKNAINLVPTDSIVSMATSGTETLKSFNVSAGYGCVAYESNLPGNAVALSANTPVSVTGASQQSIATLTYATALSLSGKRTVYGGSIYGPDTGVRITIDGNIVLSDLGRYLGDESTGANYSIVQIPPCKCESSILIECYNRSGSTSEFGWRFYYQ